MGPQELVEHLPGAILGVAPKDCTIGPPQGWALLTLMLDRD